MLLLVRICLRTQSWCGAAPETEPAAEAAPAP
jgi:hypothetical protein